MIRTFYLTLVVLLASVAPSVGQTIDCDAPAPTTPGVIRTGQPFTVSYCVPSTVDIKNPDGTIDTVPNRIDGTTGQVDTNTPGELGKPTLGAPSPISKLSPISVRVSSSVQKGLHQILITPWNCPLDTNGVPMTTCTVAQRQNGPAVAIPFVASDGVLPGAPPAIQKGRVTR